MRKRMQYRHNVIAGIVRHYSLSNVYTDGRLPRYQNGSCSTSEKRTMRNTKEGGVIMAKVETKQGIYGKVKVIDN